MNAHRILYVSSGRTFGGAEQVMLSLASAFAGAGCDVLATYHPDNTVLSAELTRRGLSGHALPEVARRTDTGAFADFVRDSSPDLVHIHRTWPLSDRHAGRGARQAGARVIATEHVRIEEAGLRDRVAKRVLSRYDDVIIAVSDAVRRSITSFWGVDDRRVVTIPNGVDVDLFARARVSARQGVHFSKDAAFCIGAIGRLERQKNLPALVHAFGNARRAGLDAELRIVGDGSERTQLEQAIERTGEGERVKILPRLDDIPGFLAELDLFVLPSLWEGLPLTILEAMACGAPIVATEVDGTREALTHGEHALLVPPDDSEALTQAIMATEDDREGAARRAAAASRRVRDEFSFASVVARHREIYES